MNHHRTARLWRSAAQFTIGSLALGLLTAVCFRFRVYSTTVALLYLIIIVLVSLTSNLVPSALIAVIATLCLDAFFTEPQFHPAIREQLDIVAPIAFLTTALVINRLMSKVRKSFEDRKRAEETLRKSQAELAHINRVMTMGELAASIAHEVNQPLAAIVNNGSACLRWLSGEIPNLDEAREAARRIVRDGTRAGEIITRIRSFLHKTGTERTRLDINQIIQQTVRDVVSLTQNEAEGKGAEFCLELAAELPDVSGDRVQLQQVILNLVMNGIEAMASVTDRPRELLISSRRHEPDQVLVVVQDSGTGLDGQNLGEIFNAFYTTKQQGLGMGLAISRSIVEDHGGRLWAVPNNGHGATFQFTLLKYQEER